MTTFLGQLHPLLVHFPVALLIVAALVIIAARVSPGERTFHTVGLLLWGAALGGVASVAAGFLLAQQSFFGGFDAEVLDWHVILGYSTAALACASVAVRHKTTPGHKRALAAHLLAIVGAVTVSVCGYLGGELVHGHDHLLTGFEPEETVPEVELASLQPPTGVAGATVATADTLAFRRDIRPVLKRSCFKCHSAKKREGGLRLDTRDHALAGGDSGPAVVPGDPMASLMIERIRLPGDHEDFMPTKGDPLTKAEVERLSRWVEQGARFY